MKTYRPPIGTKTRTGLIGQRFGKLVILKMLGVEVGAKYPHVHYLVRCDCGNEKAMPVNNVRQGNRSCGCVAPRNNGASLHPLYGTWRNMIDRCYNPAAVGYAGYGGRGISVCDRWRANFFHFLDDMGERPRSDMTLDRVNNDGNYEPSNCRWASRTEQAANKREYLRPSAIERDGKKQGLTAWSRDTGIKYRTIRARSSKGYSADEILSTDLKRKPHLITYNGETKTLAEWADHVGVKRKTLYLRVITRKWPLDRAFGGLERTPRSGGRR
jgi:hypothetical protein